MTPMGATTYAGGNSLVHRATPGGAVRLSSVLTNGSAVRGRPLAGDDPESPASAVTGLYQAHALELVRLATVILGDREAAQDVVQDAYLGLYRRWRRLRDPAKALTYLRSSVLNGCRTALRRRRRHDADGTAAEAPTGSAEDEVLFREHNRAVLAAVRELPRRQREALVLRVVFELSEEEMAEVMGISRGTVKSTVSRARAALARALEVTR